MGLDMYLKREPKAKYDENATPEELREAIFYCGDGEVCYWRKANMIRQWFVDHTDYPQDGNCQDHIVTKEQLEELRNTCLTVAYAFKLDWNAGVELAKKILPTSEGFFFGSDEYDKWYVEEIITTAEKLAQIIDETDWNKAVIVYYEWW